MSSGPATLYGLGADERAFTEPVTNVAVLSPAAFEHDIALMLQGEPLAPRFVPSFIHEVTHHRCFFSPVGQAAAWVNLRARRRAVWASSHRRDADGRLDFDFEDDTPLDILDDFIRYETVMEALRPLTEGLALFAENDVVPGDSPSVSEVMSLVARHCVRFRSYSVFEFELPAYLHGLRRRQVAFDRKLHLLLQPMDTDLDGYLPGYLAVKNTWRAGVSREPRLQDTDLFMQYVIASVFHDFGIVAEILDEAKYDSGAAQSIANQIGYRLSRLLQGDIGARLDELEATRGRERIAFTPESIAAITRPNLDTDPELWDIGHARLREAEQKLNAEAAGDDPTATLARKHRWDLAQRELIVLARTPVEARIDENGEVRMRVRGRELVAGSADGGWPPGDLPAATLILAINPSPWAQYSALTLTAGGRTVRTWFNPDVDERLRTQFGRYDLDSERRLDEAKLLAMTLDEVVSSDGTNRVVVTAIREIMSDWRRRTYGMRALLTVPEDEIPPLLRSLNDGFAPILGGVRLVRALAWLGLNAGTPTDCDEVALHFEQDRDLHGCDGELAPLVAEMNERAHHALGMPLVAETNDLLMAVV